MTTLNKGSTNPKFKELLDYRDSGSVRIEHFDGFGYEEYTKSEIIGILSGFHQDEVVHPDDQFLHVTLEVLIPNRHDDEWAPERPDLETWDDEDVRYFIHDSYGVTAYNLYESAQDVHITLVD